VSSDPGSADPACRPGRSRWGGTVAGAIVGLLTAVPPIIGPDVIGRDVVDVTAQVVFGWSFLFWYFVVFFIPFWVWLVVFVASLCLRQWKYSVHLVKPAIAFSGVFVATITVEWLLLALF
jgi:hypothetical protein